MSDKSNDKDQDNLLHFPGMEERKKKAWQKKKDNKLSRKEQKEQEKLEEEYRRQYRTEQSMRAKMQAGMARQSASGKVPLINWHKIPPFTRVFVGAILVTYLITTFALDDAQRLALYMNFGFVPAYYSGTIAWNWSALVAPFTTALIHGSWMHILTNCIMMAAMGVFFERQFGVRITLIFFIFSLMSGNLVYFLFDPASTTPVVGASGAISGLFGATILIMHASGLTNRMAGKRGPLPFIVLWISIIVIMGVLSSDTAWQAHLGGFIGGIGLFQLWNKGKIKL